MKAGSWFAPVPPDHIKVGISRGVPRDLMPGFHMYRKLTPGPCFKSVSTEEYCRLYQAEVLDRLDPGVVIAEITAKADGKIPVLCCYERVGGRGWCHRSLAAQWLAAHLGHVVPEAGFERLPQHRHPMLLPVEVPSLFCPPVDKI